MIPRIVLKALGFIGLQQFDTVDAKGNIYDYTTPSKTPPWIQFGTRRAWFQTPDGFWVSRTVSGTKGPIGGWFVWPGKGGRTQGQWAQVFPAKITSSGPFVLATPVKTGDGTGWTLSTDLDDTFVVYTSDGSSPPVGTFGIVVVGTELGDQNPLFFQGGSGSTLNLYQVTMNNANGTYSLQQYDHPGGATIGGVIALCKEFTLSVAVPTTTWVWGQLLNDGTVWFDKPLGC